MNAHRGREGEARNREGEEMLAGVERKEGERLLCPGVYLRHGSVNPLLAVLHGIIWQGYFEHEAYERGQTTDLWLNLPCWEDKTSHRLILVRINHVNHQGKFIWMIPNIYLL